MVRVSYPFFFHLQTYFIGSLQFANEPVGAWNEMHYQIKNVIGVNPSYEYLFMVDADTTADPLISGHVCISYLGIYYVFD